MYFDVAPQFDVPARRETMSDAVTHPPLCDAEVDASGLSCPLPLLKAKLELNRLGSGAVLKVIATDAGSQRDLRTFAKLSGHALLHEEVEAGVYTYWLRKA
jgi:TusA-related sulfurtransferase